jgi:hypothetical protein
MLTQPEVNRPHSKAKTAQNFRKTQKAPTNPSHRNNRMLIRLPKSPLISCRSHGFQAFFQGKTPFVLPGLTSMKTIVRVVFLSVMAFVSCMSDSQAAGPGACPPWRPCGPGNSFGGNRLLPQGGFGADFRTSCATHDACLASGRSRHECDREFYNNMNCACESSRHPFLCRVRAFRYYAGVRLFGGLYY